MAVYGLALLDAALERLAGAAHREMPVAGGDIGMPGLQLLPIARLAHRDAALLVEALGEHAGEHLRHVLHDHDWRGRKRQAGENLADRFRAPGGGADGDQLPLEDLAVRRAFQLAHAGTPFAALAGPYVRPRRGAQAFSDHRREFGEPLHV